MPTNAQRSYVSGKFMFDLDETHAGFVKSVEGGGISAEVVSEAAGPAVIVKKHIGQPKYEDFTMQIGLSMSKAVYDWIAASWQMNVQRKNGAILACDYNLDIQSGRDFTNALITEVTIPAMDASDKNPCYLTVRFAPESTRFTKGGGKLSGEFGKGKQQQWLPSNFRLEIEGLDCTRVHRVDSFTVRQMVVSDDIGDARDYDKEPGKLEFPNLKVSLAEATAQSWLDWHDDFVVKGNNDDSKEKKGSLVFLSPNRQSELARVDFFNLGIFKLSPEKAEANADQIRRIRAEMYCERMEFKVGGSVIE